MNVLLLSTYDLGHQPFGLASPKAWLERAGHSVTAVDLAVEKLADAAIQAADWIGFYLPMHTATRLALPVMERARRVNPAARMFAYGLYAPLNGDLLRAAGVEALIGGEFEAELVRLIDGERAGGGEVSLERLRFFTPERRGLPPPSSYAHLRIGGESKMVAYTEASRGCKHLCRHCPIVPVYRGNFRVVDREVVLADLRQQIEAGAGHVTFGDPDFFNGPSHAMRIVDALHAEFPAITYDAVIKVEHLLKHRDLLPRLRESGCLFVTSAVESVDDRVLAKLEKNHTRRDFFEATALMRAAGLTLQPTFIAFTPWTTCASYCDLLRALRELDLVENVAPVQLALRLLVTNASRLLELDDIQRVLRPFDAQSLVYPWVHEDAAVDRLGARVFQSVAQAQKQGKSRGEIFQEVCEIAGMPENFKLIPRAAIPYLDEPWYC